VAPQNRGNAFNGIDGTAIFETRTGEKIYEGGARRPEEAGKEEQSLSIFGTREKAVWKSERDALGSGVQGWGARSDHSPFSVQRRLEGLVGGAGRKGGGERAWDFLKT